VSDTSFRRALRRAEQAVARADPALGKVIARVGPCGLSRTDDFAPFHALTRSICHQQLHGKAAETIHQRVKDAFGDGANPDVRRVHRARLTALRACGLSEAKALAIKDLARKCLDGTVPSPLELAELSDEDVIERVTLVRGIGRWTVEMMLMFWLGRLDVWPVDDFGVRKGFTLLRTLKEPITAKALVPHGERWRPFRSVASWYLWRVAEGR
jgi:DNA-3-methyladenine glycosylase II